MKRFLKRAGILLGVFILGVIGTSLLMNNKMTDNRSEMNNPVLPEVMISVDDVLTNRIIRKCREILCGTASRRWTLPRN